MELTPHQLAILERLAAVGFSAVAFPKYASAIGLRRGGCAALLIPSPAGGLALQGEPCWLIGVNLAVPIQRNGKKLYVWKKESVEATPELEAELKQFKDELLAVLTSAPHVPLNTI